MIEIIRNGDLWVVCDREAGRVYGRYRSFETAVRHKEIVQSGEERRLRALERNREVRAAMAGA